jgi:hypothetical protein
MSARHLNKRAAVSARKSRAFYLLRLAAGYLALIAALVVGVTCELASCFAWAIASDHNVIAASFGTVVLMASGGLGWRLFRSTIDKVSCMPYVPPVREQIAALEDASVLVRSSSASVGSESELLRAEACGKPFDQEELLRSAGAASQ